MFESQITTIQLTLPFIVCTVFLIFFKPIAYRFGIVDRPNERKKHTDNIPIIGGLGIFISFSSYTVISGVFTEFYALMTGCFLLLTIGIIDDIKDLNPKIRLVCQLFAALIMVFGDNLVLQQIGNITGSGVIYLSILAIPFTVFAVIGAINAYNMIDGVDGLAGTLIIMTIAALAFICYQNNLMLEFQFLSALISSIVAFNAFNARFFGRQKASIFMGDAGSMFLGFLIAWFLVYLSQKPIDALSPVSAGWIFGLPLIDAVCVILRRILKGQSPLIAGRDHLHHQLLDYGFSVNQALAIMALIQGTMISVGLYFNHGTHNETALFWMLIAISTFHLLITPTLLGKSLERTARI